MRFCSINNRKRRSILVDKSIYFDRSLNASLSSSRSIIKVSVFICEQIHNVKVSPSLENLSWAQQLEKRFSEEKKLGKSFHNRKLSLNIGMTFLRASCRCCSAAGPFHINNHWQYPLIILSNKRGTKFLILVCWCFIFSVSRPFSVLLSQITCHFNAVFRAKLSIFCFHIFRKHTTHPKETEKGKLTPIKYWQLTHIVSYAKKEVNQ